MTTKRRPNRGGRPTRRQASAKALKNVDLSDFDARRILKEIALDSSQPGTARVAACRALLSDSASGGKPATRNGEDSVNERALRGLAN